MKILKLLFGRCGIFMICILAQTIWSLNLILNFSNYFIAVNTIFTILSILVVLEIIKSEKYISNKMHWIIIIALFPLFGGLLYILVGTNLYTSPTLKKFLRSNKKINKYLKQDEEILNKISIENLEIYGQTKYISKYSGYPIYENDIAEYYPIGEAVYEKILEELKKAKKFIFLEYFIIEQGQMWQGVLDILEQKVKEGVEVRVIYDDMGCIGTLPYHYNRILESKGIKCVVFNRFLPIFAVFMNNRDHRKIIVIDGEVAFSGGINLADEYINKKVRFGHWKDNGIMIKGEAVWNFTVMFLQIWNVYKNEDKDFTKFKCINQENKQKDGYIVPYGECPLDGENVGENIYLNIINQAKRYVYIFTPYLIIDDAMVSALTLASKRGVDVRIVTPGIPDKKTVFLVTKSYYNTLIREGVKIYEYTPGFMHSKVFVSDDIVATVGSLNLDYRSLYLHFECGIYMYNSKVIQEIKDDVIDTINKSHLVSIKECKSGFMKSIIQSMLKVFAPLL